MEDEKKSTCPAHEFIQRERADKYKEISERFELLEARVEELHKTSIPRDVFWRFVGIVVMCFIGVFGSYIAIYEKLNTHKEDHVTYKVLDDWKSVPFQRNGVPCRPGKYHQFPTLSMHREPPA